MTLDRQRGCLIDLAVGTVETEHWVAHLTFLLRRD